MYFPNAACRFRKAPACLISSRLGALKVTSSRSSLGDVAGEVLTAGPGAVDREVPAVLRVLSEVDVRERLEVRREVREHLEAERAVLQTTRAAIGVEVAVAPALVLVVERAASRELVLPDRPTEAALDDLVLVRAVVELEVAVVLEVGLAGDHVDRAASGVLAPQSALRSAQHLDALEIEQREAGSGGVTDVNVVEVEADGVREVELLLPGADAADPPARAAVPLRDRRRVRHVVQDLLR